MPWHADAPDLPLHWTLTMTFPLLPGVVPSCFALCPPTSACLSPSASSPSYLFRFLLFPVCYVSHSISKYNQACLPLLLPLPLSASSSSRSCLTNLSVPRQSDLTCLYITIQSPAPSTSSAQWDPKVCYWHGCNSQHPWKGRNIIRSAQPESWLSVFLMHQICFSESARLSTGRSGVTLAWSSHTRIHSHKTTHTGKRIGAYIHSKAFSER